MRIPINLSDSNNFIPINLNQHFDTLEVLSLKISQEDIFKSYNSDYGVLVGRVTVNGGFGIPNAKISIFIPVDNDDDALIKKIYPYESILDVDNNNVRYNLLENNKQFDCHTPVGTFPNKRKILDNNVLLEIYDKYYKFTTSTNNAGDYMIFGVPIGLQQVHLDVDLSDIGFASIKPYDLITQGYNPSLFDSNIKFKGGDDLDSLVQIKSQNSSINIKPFWSDTQEQDSGINRLDFKLAVDITPTALLVGSTITDQGNNTVSRNCRPKKDTGKNCELQATQGTIEMYRKISEDIERLEYLNLGTNGQIDADGTFIVPIKMNLNRVITDEFGNLILSENPNIGIPTTAKARLKITLDELDIGARRRTASYLVPNMYNQYGWGPEIRDENLYEFKWKKIYTVSNYIPRYQVDDDIFSNSGDSENNRNFIGIKEIQNCSTINTFPFNRGNFQFNPLFSILCVIVEVIRVLANIVNAIPGVDVELPCEGDDLSPNSWADCTKTLLAESLGAIEYEFYNDWIMGTLYFPFFKYKVRSRKSGKVYERFCDYDCREVVGTPSGDIHYRNRCRDSYVVDLDDFNTGTDYFLSDQATANIALGTGRGIIVENQEDLYYAARHDVDVNEIVVPDLTPSGDINGKNQLLLATNIQPLGSMVDCDVDGEPLLFPNLESTSYSSEEQPNDLFSINGCVSITFTNTQRERFIKICQAGVDVLNTEDGFDPSVLDSEDSELREYLCRNFHYYPNNNNYTYNVTTSNVTDDNGETYEVSEDLCVGCNNNANIIRRLQPYYFYFGLNNGRTAFSKTIANYFASCE